MIGLPQRAQATPPSATRFDQFRRDSLVSGAVAAFAGLTLQPGRPATSRANSCSASAPRTRAPRGPRRSSTCRRASSSSGSSSGPDSSSALRCRKLPGSKRCSVTRASRVSAACFRLIPRASSPGTGWRAERLGGFPRPGLDLGHGGRACRADPTLWGMRGDLATYRRGTLARVPHGRRAARTRLLLPKLL